MRTAFLKARHAPSIKTGNFDGVHFENHTISGRIVKNRRQEQKSGADNFQSSPTGNPAPRKKIFLYACLLTHPDKKPDLIKYCGIDFSEGTYGYMSFRTDS